MTKPLSDSRDALPLGAVDLQILLVLTSEDLYGYAIQKAVERESNGVLKPEIGSFYRVLARLVDSGFVEEAPSPPSPSPEPRRGRPRRYYRITDSGLEVARAEVRRLKLIVQGAEGMALEGTP